MSIGKLAEIRAVYDAFGGQVENRMMQQLYSKKLMKLLKKLNQVNMIGLKIISLLNLKKWLRKSQNL